MKSTIIKLLVSLKLLINRVLFFFCYYLLDKPILVGGHAHSRNFGDAINLPLIRRLSGRYPIPKKFIGSSTYKNSDKFLFIGSVIGETDSKTIIYGAGCISANDIPKEKPKLVLAVRGPLTRDLLVQHGIPCPPVFADPALLLPYFYMPTINPTYKLGIIPHTVDADNHYVLNLLNQGVHFINIKLKNNNWKKMIDEIAACEIIISTSLHGLIVGDTYRKKTLWVKVSDEIIGDDFKFFDYYASMGINKTNIHPIDLRIVNPTLVQLIDLATFKPVEKIDLNSFLEQNPWKQ